jgi:hypothetical protein
VEQYEEGHCEVCKAVFNLPTSEGGTLEAGRSSQAVAYTKMEVGRDCYGFYFRVTQDTHW